MTWTTDLPTQPGYYWAFDPDSGWFKMILHDGDDRYLRTFFSGWEKSSFFKGLYFLGPLKEPEKPKEPERDKPYLVPRPFLSSGSLKRFINDYKKLNQGPRDGSSIRIESDSWLRQFIIWIRRIF